MSSSNKVHICYGGTNVTNKSGTWQSFVVDDNRGRDCSIALDSGDKVHIAYQGHGNTLKYATNKTGVWQIQTVDSLRDTGWHPDIAVDSACYVHISYFGMFDGPFYRYATNKSGSWVKENTGVVMGSSSGSWEEARSS